jgi:hypothetical protein
MIPDDLLTCRIVTAAKIITFLYCLATTAAHAQEPPSPGTDQIGISAGGGYTFTHTDFQHSNTIPSPVFSIGVHYFSLQFLEISLDAQVGLLKGGSSDFRENVRTGFENKYWASCLSFRFFPVGLVENNSHDKVISALSTFYFGTGLGYLKSNTTANPIPIHEYGSMVSYKGSDFFVPLELGLNIPLIKHKKNLFLLNLNLRNSLCLSDEIDGYVPTVEANKFNDAFSTLTTGVIYKFGL